MTQLVSQLTVRFPFLSKWTKLIGLTGGGQIVVQGSGFLCGILIVRLLTQEQYAYYTLVNAMLGTMVVLADGGISTGVNAIGGEVWRDRHKLGQAVMTGLRMRRQFAVYSLLVSVPALFYLLSRQGVSVGWSLLLIASLIPTFWFSLSGSLYQIVPRLHQEIKELLRIPLESNGIRLAFTGLALAIFPLAALALLGTGVGQAYTNHKLLKLSGKYLDLEAGESEEYRRRIYRVVWRVLPGSIYYCLSSQITVWLISIFGGTTGIAEIGALGRLMALLVVVKSVIDTLIVPRFTRMPGNDRNRLTVRFFQVVGLVLLLALLIVGLVYLFPDLMLFVLGSKYADLQYELLLMAAGTCLVMVSETAGKMAVNRAIIPGPIYFIPFMIISQLLILLYLVDYRTVQGVLYFSIYSALSMIVFRSFHFLYHQYLRTGTTA